MFSNTSGLGRRKDSLILGTSIRVRAHLATGDLDKVKMHTGGSTIGQPGQYPPSFSSALELMLSYCPNVTLRCMIFTYRYSPNCE